MLDYLETNLGYVGAGEYVRAPVIRICKDSDEMRVYDKGGQSGGFAVITTGGGRPHFVFDREITTYKDTNGVGYRWGDSTLASVAEHWVRERDEDLYQDTPSWLQIGLTNVFGMSRSKGGKLEFYNDSDERVTLSQAVHSGKLAKIQDLVKMDQETLWNDRGHEGAPRRRPLPAHRSEEAKDAPSTSSPSARSRAAGREKEGAHTAGGDATEDGRGGGTRVQGGGHQGVTPPRCLQEVYAAPSEPGATAAGVVQSAATRKLRLRRRRCTPDRSRASRSRSPSCCAPPPPSLPTRSA